MRKILKNFIFLFICVVVATLFVACNKKPQTSHYVQITLDYDYEFKIDNISLLSGDILPQELHNIERSGYSFEGWYDDNELWDVNAQIKKDIKLKAKWKKILNATYFNVTFIDGDGSILDTMRVEYGKDAYTNLTPYLDEYHKFKNWNKDITNVTQNMTVYPEFDYNRTAASYFYYQKSGDGYVITGALDELPNVLCLPERYNNKKVYGIVSADTYQNGVFAMRDNLTKVYIPNTYKKIGDFAFYKSKNITDVCFENESELSEIGVMSFAEIYLDNISLPRSKEGVELRINTGAFMNCYYLNSINLNSALVEIGASAFYNAGAVDARAVDAKVFSNVTLTLPSENNLQIIKDNAFKNSAVIGNLVLDKLISLGDNAFYGNMISSITFNELRTLGDYAFYPRSINNALVSRLNNVKLGKYLQSIGAYAFVSAAIKEIEFPNSLTSIGDCAFMNSELEMLEIPSTIQVLGEQIFQNCKNLVRVTYSTDIKVPHNMFAQCIQLKRIAFLGNIMEIGNNAFKFCQALDEINIPNSLVILGESAFEKCISLQNIRFNKIQYMGERAFNGCSALQDIYFESINKIASYSFADCVSITTVTINSGLSVIGDYAFYRCLSLSKIAKINSITHIGQSAFEETALTVFNFSPVLNFVGENAFKRCGKLTQVNIPSNSIEIEFEDGVFSESTFMDRINVEEGNKFYSNQNNDGHLYNDDGSELILFVAGVKTTYKTPSTLIKIGKKAFSGNIYLQNLIIGSSVKEIGENAFSRSTNDISTFWLLRNVDFSSATSLETIGDYAFYNCNLISLLDLGNCKSLRTIGAYSFYNCFSINQLVLPDSITSIGESCFAVHDKSKYNNFCELDLSNSQIEYIGQYAFQNMDSLKSALLPSTLKELGEGAFFDCTYLSEVDIKDTNITNIQKNTFRKTALKTVELPKNIVSLGKDAFSYSSIQYINLYQYTKLEVIDDYCFYSNYLTVLNLPSTLTYIGEYAFAQNQGKIDLLDLSNINLKMICKGTFLNSNIISIELPTSLQTIDTKALAGNLITKIEIPNTVTKIDEYAFENNLLLNEVYLGEDEDSMLNEIGLGAFNNCIRIANVYVYAKNSPQIFGPIFSQTDLGTLQPLSQIKIYVGADYYLEYFMQWSIHASQISIM